MTISIAGGFISIPLVVMVKGLLDLALETSIAVPNVRILEAIEPKPF